MSGNTQQLDVCYIFRKPNPLFFSIEKIFYQVATIVKSKAIVSQIVVPHARLLPWNIFQNLMALRKEKAGVYHVTGDAHYLVMGLPGKKTLLTIHDCVFMYNSGGIKRTLLKYLFLKWPVNHCKFISTISEQSRADIIRYTGCSPDKVVVIPNPIDQKFHFIKKVFNVSCPVILFIGSTPNKNLERVINAVKGINCVLDIVGKIPTDLELLMKNEHIQYRQSAGLTDAQLVNKYIECDLVLFPSTFEGFGLPIIEAQQTGRPVITSNISPMKEVAGDAACLVDPFSIESIRKGIIKLSQDENYREDLIKKGLINTMQYKPEQIAEQYLNIYQRIQTSSM